MTTTADKYDAPYEVARLAAVAAEVPGGPGLALDVGSGSGMTTDLLEQRGWDAVGVDLTPAGHRSRVVRGDVRRLPVRSASVDLVCCLEVIEHVLEQEVLLRELRRVVRPGGWLVLSSPNRLSLQALAGKVAYTFRGRRWDYGDPSHVSVRTSFTIARLVERAGFVVTRRVGFQLLPHRPRPLHRIAYSSTAAPLARMLGYVTIIVARARS